MSIAGCPRWRLSAALALFAAAFGFEATAADLAIIIDDLGNNQRLGERALNLPGPVAGAFLPDSPFAASLAQRAHARGKEVMLHLPLEPSRRSLAHPASLMIDDSRDTVLDALRRGLDVLPHVVGVNNHQGSAFSEQAVQMQWLMDGIAGHGGLFFVDSRTSARSVGLGLARGSGVAAVQRDVFLDNVRTPDAVVSQWERVLRIARKRGSAVAIGHPYPETLALLEQHLPDLAEQGIRLVPVGALVHTGGGAPRTYTARAEPQPRRPARPKTVVSAAPAARLAATPDAQLAERPEASVAPVLSTSPPTAKLQLALAQRDEALTAQRLEMAQMAMQLAKLGRINQELSQLVRAGQPSEFKTAMTAARQEDDRLTEALRLAQAEATAREAAVFELQTALAARNDQVAALRAERGRLDTRQADAARRRAQQLGQLEALESTVSRQADAAETLRDALRDRDAQIAALRSERQRTDVAALALAERRAESLEAELSETRAALDAQRAAQRLAAQQAIEQARLQASDIAQGELAELRTELAASQAATSKARQQSINLAARVAALRKASATAAAPESAAPSSQSPQLREALAKLAEAAQARTRADKRADALRRERDRALDARDRAQRLASEQDTRLRAEIERQASELMAARRAASTTRASADSDARARRQTLAALRAQVRELETSLAAARAQVRSMADANAGAIRRANDNARAAKTMAVSVEGLRGRLQRKQAELDVTKRALAESQARLGRLQSASAQ